MNGEIRKRRVYQKLKALICRLQRQPSAGARNSKLFWSHHRKEFSRISVSFWRQRKMTVYALWSKLGVEKLSHMTRSKWNCKAFILLEYFWNDLMLLSISIDFSRLPLDKQTNILAELTHIVCQNKHTRFSADEEKAIKQANIICVNMLYLNDLILNENAPDVKAHLFKLSKA